EREFGSSLGFGDSRVVLVDPAAGSGAYALAAVHDALVRGACASSMASRMVLFESQVGAAVIARARLERAVRADVVVRVDDALESDARLDGEIVVCMGNPPYRRGIARRSVREFTPPGAGVHAKNLHNEYVHFWRWAIERVFASRVGPGIVSFVSAASYLHGP